MIHVSVNFVPPPVEGAPSPVQRLRKVTWLLENARHLKKIGSAGGDRLHVVFVGHTQELPRAFVEELEDSYTVHMETPRYEALCTQHAKLVARMGGPYMLFAFAFLRWLLIGQLFGQAPVLCYDGDILHNVPLAALADAFRGKTRTATSTAFAAISDASWFTGWARNLALLDNDPHAFQQRFAGSLPHGAHSFQASPEEFFAKCLIEAGEIPQDEVGPDFPFWIVPQPHLLPRLFNFVETQVMSVPVPMDYARIWGSDTLNGKPLAFWHMQKPFMSQLSALAIFRESWRAQDPGRIFAFNHYGVLAVEDRVRFADPYHERGGYDTVPPQLKPLAAKLIAAERANTLSGVAPEQDFFHPAFLYNYYFERYDFSPVFNNRRWPKTGCWQG
ncbi:hypothetical protein [Aestuariivirga sp.]|uniref:hypothetical protein n=1 Tax=Aestuariivirga sp. TaxID=2650926 RepID=UPI003BA89A07